MDAGKICAIQEWPTPATPTQVRSFLGLAGFYRWFVRDFSTIAAPLHELTKKALSITWLPRHDAAFAALKDALCRAPLLQLPSTPQLLPHRRRLAISINSDSYKRSCSPQ